MEPSSTPNGWPPVEPLATFKSPQLASFQRGLALRDRIFNLLGQMAVLLPTRPGQKAPVHAKYNDLHGGNMSEPKWIEELGRPGRGTGVLLGAASRGLHTLDFDKVEHQEAFLALNSAFRSTLTTAGARGANHWFVLELPASGLYPASFDVKEDDGSKGNKLEFRGNKRYTIVDGTHPTGVNYRVVNEAKPIRVRWEDLRFPDGWDIPPMEPVVPRPPPPPPPAHAKVSQEEETLVPEVAAVRCRFGAPFFVTEKGKVDFDQTSLAAHFAVAKPVKHFRGAGFYEYLPATGVWSPKTSASTKTLIAEFLGEIAEGNPEILVQRTDRFLTEVANQLMGVAEVEWSATTANKDLLHLGNGMLDLTVTPPVLRPFSPDYLSLAAISHQFDPEAICPGFFEFLQQGLEDDDQLLSQKFAGLVLSRDNFVQAFLLLVGVAGAGKGTFVDVLQQMIGRSNCAQLRTAHLDTRFETARFIGKPLLVGPDVQGDFLNLKGAQLIKALTGGDVIDAELKGQNSNVALRGNFNIVITSNRRLRLNVDEDQDAWRRRLKLIAFTRKAAKAVPNLASQLVAKEASGILNWMIEGLRLLDADFAEHGKWVLSDKQEQLIDDLLAESDSISAFVREEVEIGNAQMDSITTEELERAYDRFCSDKNWVPQSTNVISRQLPNVLADLFNVHKRHDISRAGTDQRGYKGIRLKHPVKIPDLRQRDLGGSGYGSDKM